MPLTAAEGAQGSQKTLQWVKNRNNIIEMYMRKEVNGFQRQKDLNIALIDQDRLDIHDFLKELRRCDSDLTPEAKTWLGERTLSGRRREPLKRVSTAPAKVKIEEPNQDREARTAPAAAEKKGPPDDMEKYGFRFKVRDTPDMVKRSMTFCNIFSRRNELSGKKSLPPSEKGDDNQSEMRATSVSFQDTSLAKPYSACGFTRDLESAFTTVRLDDESAAKAKSAKNKDSQGQPDFMKQLLIRKYHRRKKQKKPLEERIEAFFQEIEQVKDADVEFAQQPTEKEMKRKWKIINHGVKAAIAESSDEEDLDEHTL